MSLNSQTLDRPIFEPLPQIEAEIHYLASMAEKPFNYTYEPPSGTPRQNTTYETHRLPICDARAIVPQIDLDREGFALATQRSTVQDFYNEEELRQVYYPEAEALVKAATGARQVLVFDHNVRNAERAKQGVEGIREPVKRAHNDFTAQSGYRRARDVLAARDVPDAEALLQGRFAIVNVWRPITNSVQESPLAICDAQSIAPQDWVAADLIYRDWVGETYVITYNPSHRWFYFPALQPDEALLIKCFDAATDGQARFTAHTAFDDPTSPPNAPARASIELRTLVFY